MKSKKLSAGAALFSLSENPLQHLYRFVVFASSTIVCHPEGIWWRIMHCTECRTRFLLNDMPLGLE